MYSILKNTLKTLFIFSLFVITSCNDDTANPGVSAPETYSFTRDGQSTVAFGGQTTRIQMAEELVSTMLDFNTTEATLQEMFANETADGNDANPFSSTTLNESTKSIRSKVAASTDFFAANTVDAAGIKSTFESWITQQAANFDEYENQAATPGVTGQIADGTSVRYVTDFGIEPNQLLAKGLIGALMVDQMLNNYLSPAVLDEASNIENNDNEVVEDGQVYTTMEHKWDEAYGYLYGLSADLANPNATIGTDDNFLNKYVGKVDQDADFTGIADDIFEAFKLGRAAIEAGDYVVRDEQAAIIRQKISEVIAIRAVYYLQAAKDKIETTPINTGGVFHDISEALGFIYSLQFTRRKSSVVPHFSSMEVQDFFIELLSGGPDGLWNITPGILDSVSTGIAIKFDFSVEDAR